MLFNETEEQTIDTDTVPSYTILNEAQIRQRLENDISRVSAAISEPRASAIVLLRRFNWNLSKLFDHWFEDEHRVRAEVGLFPIPTAQTPSTICGICFETYTDTSAVVSASCGHPFCRSCWSKYIAKSINEDNAETLLLTCPEPRCIAAVGEDMIEALAESLSDKEKYSRFLLRSYIEDSYMRKRIKWCPAPNCSYAFDFTEVLVAGRRNFTAECRCSCCFCWNCSAGAHCPVDCDTAARWLFDSIDMQSMRWIIANTKACPNCHRPIQKESGCDRIKCAAPCGHEFCWSSLMVHPPGEVRSCKTLITGNTVELEALRALPWKYEQFYKQWEHNLKLRHKAEEDLSAFKSELLDKLCLNYGQTKAIMWFIIQAWEQIIRCRRVMQWSCAYGYYFPEDQQEKKQLFEYLQNEAALSLDRLDECAMELPRYLEAQRSLQEFIVFRGKLSGLTFATGRYFENLVKVLADGSP